MDLMGWLTKQRGKQAAQPESEFFALPLRLEEMVVLLKCVSTACESEHTSVGDKQLLSTIVDRVVRWTERQGAWWSDGQNIISSLRGKIDP
jgi:hypothetical protein